jgi:hypothetical protein
MVKSFATFLLDFTKTKTVVNKRVHQMLSSVNVFGSSTLNAASAFLTNNSLSESGDSINFDGSGLNQLFDFKMFLKIVSCFIIFGRQVFLFSLLVIFTNSKSENHILPTQGCPLT